jgi:polyhydroxyalkanoate synthesis regulator protein
VKPEIMKLDNTKPWNDQANIYILLNDLNDIVKYTRDADSALDCYDVSCGDKKK